MNQSMKHYLNYIYWKKDAERKNISFQNGERLLTWLHSKGIVARSQTKIDDWLDPWTYRIEQKGHWVNAYVNNPDAGLIIYTWHAFNNDKNNGEKWQHKGQSGIRALHREFKKRTGVTFLGAFGYSDKDLKRCVPRPFYFINNQYNDKIIKGVSKGDISSCYPYECSGSLPTMKGFKILKGIHKPDEEYPFAFYKKSGHVAEFGVLDTRKWASDRYGWNLLIDAKGKEKYKNISDSEEETLLCKKSDYELGPEFEYFYNIKEAHKGTHEGEEAKLVMNATIGFFHPSDKGENTRSSFRLYHIAAICLARAGQRMLNELARHEPDNIIQAVVDCIIYKDDVRYGKIKKLGAMVQEWTDCEYIQRGTNSYMAFKKGEPVQIKHGSYDENIVTDSLESIFEWRRSKPNDIC